MARANRSAKLLTRVQVGRAVERGDDMDPLAAGQQREGHQAEIGKQVAKPHSRFFHLVEIEPDVGVEIEHQPVGMLELADLAAPAVELDRPHLHAGEDPARVLDVEIILDLAVALLDRNMLYVRAHRAIVVLLEETLLGPALGAADQADRPLGHVDQHQWLDRGVIIGEVALGEALPRDRSPGRGC